MATTKRLKTYLFMVMLYKEDVSIIRYLTLIILTLLFAPNTIFRVM